MRDVFVQQVARALESLNPPMRLLLAVSGGADSVALLHAVALALRRRALRGRELVVGHVDHGLRPDSASDAELACLHARQLGVPHLVERVAIGRTPGGLEEAARTARYAALVRMARKTSCEAVLTGHTATDQAETVLWRLARGAGARGLGAMRSRRELDDGLWLLRPLLDVSRAETRAFCERHRLAFHDDVTNVDERPRARIRAEVLPVLERLSPGATLRIAHAAERLRADDTVLESLAASLTEHAEGAVASLAAAPEPIRRRALVRWYAHHAGTRRRLAASHLAQLDQLLSTRRGEVELPSSLEERRVAVVAGGRLRFDRRSRGHIPTSVSEAPEEEGTGTRSDSDALSEPDPDWEPQ